MGFHLQNQLLKRCTSGTLLFAFFLSTHVATAQTASELSQLQTWLGQIKLKTATLESALSNRVDTTSQMPTSIPTDGSSIANLGSQIYSLSKKIIDRFNSSSPSEQLQARLDSAIPGDVILLDPAVTYTGNFILRRKTTSAQGYITIMSARMDLLPPTGVRVAPASASVMPRIQTTNSLPAITAEPGAHHYKLVGLNIESTVYNGGIVRFGDGTENSLVAVPYEMHMDRVYLHGSATLGSKRGVALNSYDSSITNSYVADIKSNSQDAQAICTWNGPGRLKILNNYLEATGENVMIGGTESALVGVVPSDIEIRGNLIRKPLEWIDQKWPVKNLLELKTGRRVLIDGNIMENSWVSAQSGWGLNLKPGQEHIVTPSETFDIKISNNIIRNTVTTFSIVGQYPGYPGRLGKVTIVNNLIEGPLKGMLLLQGAPEITVEHNTVITDEKAGTFIAADNDPSPSLVLRSNILPHLAYGLKGSGVAEGVATVQQYLPSAVIESNIIYNSPIGLATRYPSINYFPQTMIEVGLVQAIGSSKQLNSTSTYLGKAHDGSDPGIDPLMLNLAVKSSLTGTIQ